jgi:hypothetical protein
VFPVAPEELIGTRPREDDFDARGPGTLCHEKRIDCGRIADWFVEDIDHSRQQIHHVRLKFDLMQIDAVTLRDLSGVESVIGHRFKPLVFGPERNRVCVDLGVRLLRQYGHDARVESTREEARHGDVRHQVVLH